MEKQDSIKLGENIRLYRKKMGLSARELAEKVNLKSAQAILQYERGEREASIAMLIKISSALDIDLSDLLVEKKVSIKEFQGGSSTSQKGFTPNQNELLERLTQNKNCLDVSKILEIYGYKLIQDQSDKNLFTIEGNETNIKVTKEDLASIKNYVRYGLALKLKELETKEGE